MLLLLIRHALTPSTGRVLYGRSEGVGLSPAGLEQAERLAERLRPLPIGAIYSSPLERALQTAAPLAAGRGIRVVRRDALMESDAGTWTGRRLSDVRRTRAWRTVQRSPSRFRFPGGERLVEVGERAVAEVERIAELHPGGVVAVVSHADPIRLVLAHLAGAHVDHFQRIVVHPASVSAALLLPGDPPRILRVNDPGTLDDLVPGPAGGRRPGKGVLRR
ncbi:MAG: histidine phosphatase family protein [Actinobacteria bacterium]|nr:histidine phosphatase family protein [Actinomycetota bacterium]